ncbi:2-hydroxyacyl-CoA dehydratase subunit D [Anaerospora hongkongensis]|uniref:2-hydroxyacyl-CoA dehydratase subunit D n=1 Tax=Anaerospora hongkongensis TaxID=244830 RepID=UPI002898E533|nr:2-hydroxyacyl-CoA dehydratase family protein [Anaerospora hongkongensis]
MSNVDEIIAQFQAVVNNPGSYVKKHLADTGGKAIGYLYYAPQELIHAAGMLPVGIWGGNIELSAARNYLPSFYCSILQTALEMGIKGTLDSLAAVIMPANCDALRGLGQNWKVAVPKVEFISLVPPFNRKTEASVKYLLSEYEDIKAKLERISGNKITDETLTNSIHVFNKYRQTMRIFTKVARDYPDIITPSIRNAVIKSSSFMDKEKYTALIEKLIKELKTLPIKEWHGKKLVVSGIKMDSPALLKALEENSVAVVGDDLAQETRLFRSDILQTTANPMENLARYWSTLEGCSLLFDPAKKRCDMIIADVKETGADGVLFCMTKFCDPEEFDYPIFKKRLEAEDIPHVYIETDLEFESDEQARTRIQAFVEIVN